MILYSIVTMRDLIRNYKMIISRKAQDSDSETEPLSSASSSPPSFGTMREPRMFQQENYSTESEEDDSDRTIVTQKPRLPTFSIQKDRNRQTLFSSNLSTREVNSFGNAEHIYDKYHPISKLGGIYSDELGHNDIIKDYAYASFHEYKTEEDQPTHNSLVTIFAVWNTTMGSSLLAMSWGLEKTGLFSGILINILVAALCLYTTYVLLSVNEKHGMLGQHFEVPDLCRLLIGKWAEMLAKIFSLLVLIGSNIVYWILMSNFLFNSGHFLYDSSEESTTPSVICPKEVSLKFNETSLIFTSNMTPISGHPKFDVVWNLNGTVPIFLAVVMFPLLNFKSPTFFTKFNSLGTISAGYLIVFVAIKAMGWGINIPSWSAEFVLKPTFCTLTGMLSLSYFIHNIIISVMRNNKHQENNGRDLTVAFGLITFTYVFIGVIFYISFPLAKSCIEDNILNNFSKRDALTIIARILLLFQLFTVFPLISFMLRNDVMATLNMIWKDYKFGDFSYGRVVVINSVILFICIMFACFLPRIGTLIRYTGAMSGLVYIFMLPSLLKIASLKKENRLTISKAIFHYSIIAIGILNLISQFFINDK